MQYVLYRNIISGEFIITVFGNPDLAAPTNSWMSYFGIGFWPIGHADDRSAKSK